MTYPQEARWGMTGSPLVEDAGGEGIILPMATKLKPTQILSIDQGSVKTGFCFGNYSSGTMIFKGDIHERLDWFESWLKCLIYEHNVKVLVYEGGTTYGTHLNHDARMALCSLEFSILKICKTFCITPVEINSQTAKSLICDERRVAAEKATGQRSTKRLKKGDLHQDLLELTGWDKELLKEPDRLDAMALMYVYHLE